MKRSSQIFARGVQSVGPLDCVTQLPEDWRLARAAHGDLRRMRAPRFNVLLVGTDRVVQNVLEALLPDLRQPVVIWRAGERLDLPMASGVKTLLLHRIDTLPAEDQLRLLDWLQHTPDRPQIVSTTPVTLLPRVEAGTFIDMLYYRLNTVCVDVTA